MIDADSIQVFQRSLRWEVRTGVTKEGVTMHEARDGSFAGRLNAKRAWLAPLLLALGILVADASPAGAVELRGEVHSGGRSIANAPVTLLRTTNGTGPAISGRGRTNRNGRFSIDYRAPNADNALLYAVTGVPRTNRRFDVRLASMLGPVPIPDQVTINERTTVATGFSQAQFVFGPRIGGPSPGPQNAASMGLNLADPVSGKPGETLRSRPNAGRTPTLATFNTLANTLAGCARKESRCKRFFRATRIPGRHRTKSALKTFSNIARNPSENRAPIYRLASSGPAPYGPTLDSDDKPNNWSLFLRFFGDGNSVDGPGNIAFDADGTAWVGNNYQYSRVPGESVCGGTGVPVFRPDGSYAEISPVDGTDAGISGVGYGVGFDTDGDVWLSNFGFAAPGCATQPPHDTVSEFTAEGRTISTGGGYTAGDLTWPQGIVSNERGDIWIPNCGPVGGDPLSETQPHDSFTIYPDGDPSRAKSIRDPNLDKPMDVAFNQTGKAFITSTLSDKVGIYKRDGTPAKNSPVTGAGLNYPMGIASDTKGNMWVSNSGVIDLPCPGPIQVDFKSKGGSVTKISPSGGKARRFSYKKGGAKVPWGMAIDGEDNVWVSNFGGKRVTKVCGTRLRFCPEGKKTGSPISPNRGYSFSGLTRNTAVEIDPSGNVWITNNWKQIPVQYNPGGYHVVIMVGAAGAVRTPLIGRVESLR